MKLDIISGAYEFPSEKQWPISKEAKQLIKDMLDIDQDSRIDIDEILNSDWMRVF